MARVNIQPRLALYAVLNVAFVLLLGIAQAAGGSSHPRFIYVAMLFALCSTAVIDLDGMNGRYILLAMFLGAFFLYFGVGDVTDIMHGTYTDPSDAPVTATEWVILAGAVFLIAGYRLALSLGARSPTSAPRDWANSTTLTVGAVLWMVGTYATYTWYFQVVTDTTFEATRAGLSKLTPLVTLGLIFAQMLQPLGILLVAYAWRLNRSPFLLGCVLVVVFMQVVLGFVIDIKGLAMMGGILVIVTCILVDAKIPKAWVAGSAVFILLAFPIFQAYRAEVHGNRGISRTEVLDNLGKTLELAISSEDRVNTGRERAQTFFERLSLKASVQMMVTHVGNDVPFEGGYTLSPILSTFLPRIIWSDKPDIPTGQIVNKVFHLSEQSETYISPSHLGELYWNFGWRGVIVGMTTIGALCGFVARFNLAQARTVTRLLVTVLTIQQVIHGFEGSMASSYVVWFRSLAAVGILHLAFARSRSTASAPAAGATGALRTPNREAAPFPNLLR